ncbi:hypothetical protein [Sorangium sp. So ce388]|uniref:hypothetical protein n=1 Tax=Sorangium sp. So ce388 TaxID=3133309 RepID=UPI003F5BB2D5
MLRRLLGKEQVDSDIVNQIDDDSKYYTGKGFVDALDLLLKEGNVKEAFPSASAFLNSVKKPRKLLRIWFEGTL